MEIPDPPERPVCLDCNRALLWLYSARKSRWFAVVVEDANRLTVHTCQAGDRSSWRGTAWTPATPERAERAHRGAALVRAALTGQNPEPLDERTDTP